MECCSTILGCNDSERCALLSRARAYRLERVIVSHLPLLVHKVATPRNVASIEIDGRALAVVDIEADLLAIGTPQWDKLAPEKQEQVDLTLSNMEARYDYTRECALQVLGHVLRKNPEQRKVN